MKNQFHTKIKLTLIVIELIDTQTEALFSLTMLLKYAQTSSVSNEAEQQTYLQRQHKFRHTFVMMTTQYLQGFTLSS